MESLGARLKREREQRKITLDEISLSTKIGTRFLIAIEEENFDQLPGGIFNKGFVKAYARSVGVDEAEAVAEYELAVAPILPESQPGSTPALLIPALPEPGEDPGNGASRIPWEWCAVALLVVAFAFAIWGFLSRERSARPGSSPSPPAGGRSSTAAPSVVAQVAPATNAPETANALPLPSDSKPAAEASQPALPPNPGPGTGAFLIQIKAREDSWVAISADGQQVMQDTLYASAEKSVGARDKIVIKTGNAGALDISFNGKKLPTQGAHNQVKTLTLSPSGPKF